MGICADSVFCLFWQIVGSSLLSTRSVLRQDGGQQPWCFSSMLAASRRSPHENADVAALLGAGWRIPRELSLLLLVQAPEVGRRLCFLRAGLGSLHVGASLPTVHPRRLLSPLLASTPFLPPRSATVVGKSPYISKGTSREKMLDCDETRTPMEAQQISPSRDVLRTRTPCPGCGKLMTYHALAYKHLCPRVPHTREGKRLKQIAALKARIQARIQARPVPPPMPAEEAQGAGEDQAMIT
jgi:hypothetical protein